MSEDVVADWEREYLESAAYHRLCARLAVADALDCIASALGHAASAVRRWGR